MALSTSLALEIAGQVADALAHAHGAHSPAGLPLHAGLSTDVEVDTGHKRSLFGADTPPYDPASKGSVEARTAKALEMLRKTAESHIVAMHTKLPLREIMRLQGLVRAERSAA